MRGEGTRDRIRARFAAAAEAYVTSRSHAAGPDLDRLVELADLAGRERVLDVATGGGHMALACARRARRVIAIDLTEPMLRAARAFLGGQGAANAAFVLGDAEAIPFATGSFDRVTCRIAPHHFGDVGRFVGEAARVLRAGGLFLLQDIQGAEDPGCAAFITAVERLRDPSHVRAYAAGEWRAHCAAAGLQVEAVESIPKARDFLDWTGRMGMGPADQEALEAMLREAPEAIKASFDVRIEDGRVRAFTDRMLLIRARKP